jgi:tetratricopeptide (TPR) repeat protein
MRNGRQPSISYETVRAALDAMLYMSVARSPNPLEALALVDDFISNPDLPDTPEKREYALRQLLISVIVREYNAHRHNFGFEVPVSHAPLEAALDEIRRDVQQHNPELIGWCLLYYRYVRVDLNLSIESIMSIAHVEQRTLRRYQSHAIERLRDCIVSAEWDIRARQRTLRLYAMLPSSQPISLVGRDEVFKQVQSVLNGESSRHIQITGPPGIGKSTFVQEFVRRQIDDGRIDYLIWLENPESIDFARQLLHETLLSDLNWGLKEYTLTHRLVVVLDHFECARHECASKLQQFLNELDSAIVFLTSPVYIPMLRGVQHLTIRELDEQDALNMLRKTMGMFDKDSFDREHARQIYDAIGGNPYALTLAAHNFSMYRMGGNYKDVLNVIFDQSFESLDDETRQVWLIFGLCASGEVSIEALSRLWPYTIKHERVATLIRHFLIQTRRNMGHYVIPTSSRHFIQNKYSNATGILDMLIEEFDRNLTNELLPAFAIVEHILISGWPRIHPERAQKWIKNHLKEALRQGHCAQWANIIHKFRDQHKEADLDLTVALGMCLRRISQWPRAQQVLEQAIAEAGKVGQFYVQGMALFELGILYRQQGAYQKAEALFEKAEKILIRYTDTPIRNDLCAERAQAAFDRGEIDQAQTYLRDLPSTGRILAMQSEIHLLLGDFVSSFELARQAIVQSDGNPIAVGRLYTLIARICEQQGEVDSSFSYLARAIIILEREGDIWALGRTQSNMGALLIHMGNSYEAYDMLSKAENSQVLLGDRVGLESTRHNFRVLRARFGG